jgi:hypothetical protein
MSNPRIYEVEKHYLVRAEYAGNTTRNWDVYIASSGEEYFGKAELKGDGDDALKTIAYIPWVPLQEKDLKPLDEMINIMKRAFEK